MTDCADELYTVSMLLPVQKRVRAKDADAARDQVLREQIVIASIGASVGWPLEINVVKEVGQPAAKAD